MSDPAAIPSNSMQELLKSYAPLVSAAVVVIGWWVLKRQSGRSDLRKELRQLVDRTLAGLVPVVEQGLKYHTGAPEGARLVPETSWSLVVALSRISRQINLLSLQGLQIEDCDSAFIKLKQALTGGDFQSASEAPWQPTDRRFREVEEAVSDLTYALDEAYFQHFQ